MENSLLVVVVSDAGPLIHLAQIHQLALLHKLFGAVLITPTVKFEVYDEGIRLGYRDAENISKALDAEWLKVEPFPQRLTVPAQKLAEGENISKADAQTLIYAVDKKAQVLVDEKLLSSLAKMYGLKVWGTWTLLLEALSKSYITVRDVETAVEELGQRKFKLSPKQTQEVLDAARLIDCRNRIIIDQDILVGKPVIRGTRLSVEFVLGMLANGWTIEQVLKEHPQLKREDIEAALKYTDKKGG